LHYLGYDTDRGGIVSVVRALASADCFDCLLGVNPGFTQLRNPPLRWIELPRTNGEKIGLAGLLRARTIARHVRRWLGADATRIFHGHSRAGLLVVLWLHRGGERRVVVSVHCYGRQRWFYRWAARILGNRLFWLSPAMKAYYGIGDGTWAGCRPGCVAELQSAPGRTAGHDGIVRLGGIGALVRWKNWHLVLEALALLPETVRRRLKFTHIGRGDGSPESRSYETGLRARAQSEDLRGLIEWRGEQPTAASLLQECDCLVVAARNEPFSVAVIEALQAGVPVLAADSGGARDIIEPEVNGWLFPTGEVKALADRLASLPGTDALARLNINREGWRRFTAPIMAAEWNEVYRRLGES
jgi:glycosyltransferase involved in cell wall biosynthesis